ncbi:WD repeat-containing protein 54-like [Diaphorina citri]|uniref:WD repeat-containing protein 54-like n=1 Tax=Diaphorina citri TaxID=121845 RepID=A0A1S3DL15_DIACI|nr:WD repeat-containing protein 54-like [Diaphorina citri]
MYERENTLLLSSTASALCNNLSVNRTSAKSKGGVATKLAVVHQNNINIIPVAESDKTRPQYITCHNNSALCEVMQVLWCDLGFEVVLVVASTLGLDIYDRDGVDLLFSHPCMDGPEDEYSFVKGIATLNNEVLCAGNSSGVLRVFGVLDEETCLSFMDRKEGHMDAITDIASSRNYSSSAVRPGWTAVICLWEINLLCSSQINDQMLVGGRFLNTNGTGFCVSAYDTNLVHCFKT